LGGQEKKHKKVFKKRVQFQANQGTVELKEAWKYEREQGSWGGRGENPEQECNKGKKQKSWGKRGKPRTKNWGTCESGGEEKKRGASK